MAHEWDSFLDNISPLSSDPRTLTQASEAEHLENLIERGITDIVDSWQVDEEQMVKDLPSCENGEIPDFATDGLSTSGTFPSILAADLQGLKQDCGTLATSLLEDYSNVSSCSDADDGETKSPKFMASSSALNPDIGLVKKLSPEWTCRDAGKMLQTDTLSADLLESNAEFPCLLNVCTEEIQVGGSKNIVQNPETMVLAYTGHNNISHSSDMDGNKQNETVNMTNHGGCQYQKQEEDVKRTLTEKDNLDIIVGDHAISTSDGVEVHPEVHEEEHLIAIASNVPTNHTNTQDHLHQDLPIEKVTESLNKGNEEFRDLSSMSQGRDKHEVKNETEKTSSLMKNDEQDTPSFYSPLNENGNLQSSNMAESCSSTNAFNTPKLEVTSSTEIINAPSSIDQQQTSDKGLDLREGSEQNTSDNAEFCSVTNAFNTQKLELASSTGMKNAPSSTDEQQSAEQGTELRKCPVQNNFDNVELCSSTNMSNTRNMEQISSETTNAPSSTDEQQSADRGIGEDIDENGEQYPEQNDASTMEQSELDMMYGEPLSGEDASSDMDETEINSGREVEQVHKADGNGMDHTERPTIQMTSSGQLRKHLLPIVMLEPMDSVNGVTNSYDCGNCQHTTNGIDKLLEHHHNSHSVLDFQFCKTCNIYLTGAEQAERHLCGTSNADPQLSSKQKNRKWPGKHKCTICKLRFIKLTRYVSHMRTHTGTTPYQCNDCGTYFSQHCSLRKHQRVPGRCKKTVHRRKKSDANTSKMEKPPQGLLVQEKPGTCPRTDLRNCYVKLVDISKNHPCTLCCKIFPTAKKATKHFHNVHKGRNPPAKVERKKYSCPLCLRLFKHSCNMIQHLRCCIVNAVRDGKGKVNNAYPCPLCRKVFFFSSNRIRHTKQGSCLKEYLAHPVKDRATSQLAGEQKKTKDGVEEDKSSKEIGNLPLKCRSCGTRFNSSDSLELHKCCRHGERPFRCLDCGKGFKRRDHLTCHKTVHQKIQCHICKITLPTIGELIEHRKSHPKGLRQCPDCNQVFTFPVYLRRHLLVCKNKIGTTSQQPLESMRENSRPSQAQCSLCKKRFADDEELRQHSYTHISCSSPNLCPFCHRSFTVRRYLVRHMIIHTAKPLPCTKCGKQFFRDSYLKLHTKYCFPVKTTSSECEIKLKQLLKCPRCPREFSREIRYKRHVNAHKTKTLIRCSRCDHCIGRNKFGKHQSNCMGTAKLNTGIAPNVTNASKKINFNCPYCSEKFLYRSRLLRHVTKHTVVQPYVCSRCGQGYKYKSLCLKHQATCKNISKMAQSKDKIDVRKSLRMPTFSEEVERVEGRNEYKCRFCTKTFMKPRNLRCHILTHNEVNPYRCKICDSSFSRYDHLKLHQSHCGGKKQRLQVCIPKVTSADVGKGWINRFGSEPANTWKTFECEICSKRFSIQSDLYQHNKMFHPAKSFKCIRCDHLFSHESTLKKHMKRRRCKIISTSPPTLETKLPKENETEPLLGLRNQILLRIKPCFDRKHKFVCSFCPRAFRKSWQLAVHIRLHTGEKPYVCNHCDERFIRKDYLQRHLSVCAKKQQSQQINCFPKPSLSKGIVGQNHQSPSQSPPKGFSCAYCSSRFLLFSQLQEHFLNAHKLETVVPPVSTVSLQHHLSNIPKIKEENSDGPKLSDSAKSTCKSDLPLDEGFVCPVCNMSLTNKAGLSSHLRVHSIEHPLKCTICEKGFWIKSIFRNHLRKCRLGQTAGKNATQEMEVPLKAQIDFALEDSVFKDDVNKTGCGVLQTNVFQKDESSQDSEEHQGQSSSSENTKVVQYQCSECDQTFTDGLMLISHLEDHGRREHQKKQNICNKCGKVFSSERHLKKHTKCRVTNPNQAVTYSCKICDRWFLSGPALHEHYTEEHPDKMLKCRFCEKTYSTKKSLARHYKERHPKEQKEIASPLQEIRATAQQPNSHSSTAEESDEEDNDSGGSDSDSAPYFPCHVCGKTFPTFESLEDHQRCHLGEKPHECSECGRCFFQASQLQQHQRMHKSEFQCQACGRGFVSLFALRKHKHTHAKSRPFRCTKCHFSFTGPSHLAEHMKSHREESFPCDICSRVFSSKGSRAEHRKTHSISADCTPPTVSREEDRKSTSSSESFSALKKELKYRCGACNNCFKDPEELSEHGCVADKERPYSCQDCSQFFLHTSHLKKHRNTHHVSLSKKGYPCNHCDKNFSSANHFLSHLKSHVDPSALTKQKIGSKDRDNFICPVCQKHFTSAIELIGHFPKHLDRTFECHTCKIKFPSRLKLREHEQKHMTPAIECRKCGLSFMEDKALHQHNCASKKKGIESRLSNRSVEATPSTYQPTGEEEEIDVTGEDFFNCSQCSKRFSSKSALLDHQNKSHLNKPFKCDTCGKSFALRRYLKVHEKRHQSVEPPNGLECSVCQIQFPTSGDLSLHMRVLHAEKEVGQYRCDMCYKSFHHWTLLKQHQESHLGEVVYECTECDKVFAFPHLLEEHRQTH